jgi:hypothetical protein
MRFRCSAWDKFINMYRYILEIVLHLCTSRWRFNSCVARLLHIILMNMLSTLHSLSQRTYRVEMKYRCICMASQGTYTATLYVMVVTRVIGGGCALCKHPPPSPARADFSIMMGNTPEIGNRHSVCTLSSLHSLLQALSNFLPGIS